MTELLDLRGRGDEWDKLLEVLLEFGNVLDREEKEVLGAFWDTEHDIALEVFEVVGCRESRGRKGYLSHDWM